MHVVLVRHGESTNNVLLAQLRAAVSDAANYDKKRYNAEKSSDPPLSELGAAQAARLAAWFPKYMSTTLNIRTAKTRVFCSPMCRAMETAKPIAEALGIRCEIRSDIHENKGCVAGGSPRKGSSLSELLAKFGEEGFVVSEDAPVTQAGWWTNVDGSVRERETFEQSYTRAHLVAKRLRAMALEADVPTVAVVVSHGQWLSLLMQALLSPTTPCDASTRQFAHDCTGISSLVLPGLPAAKPGATGLVQLQLANCAQHLDESPAVPRSASHIVLNGYNRVGTGRKAGWSAPTAPVDPAVARVRALATAALTLAACAAALWRAARGRSTTQA